MQLAIWVGLALILVLALEGARVSLAPGHFVRRYLGQTPAKPAPEPEKIYSRSEPVFMPPPVTPPPAIESEAPKRGLRLPPPRPRRRRVVIKKKARPCGIKTKSKKN